MPVPITISELFRDSQQVIPTLHALHFLELFITGFAWPDLGDRSRCRGSACTAAAYLHKAVVVCVMRLMTDVFIN